MLCNSTTAIVIVVHTRPRGTTAGHDNMRKSNYGFPLFPYMGMGLRLAALWAARALLLVRVDTRPCDRCSTLVDT